MNVHRNSRVYSSFSHPQFRMRCEREPSIISSKIVTRLSNGKRKKSMKLYIQKYVPKSSKLKTMLCEYHRRHFLEWCRSSKFMFLSKKCFIRQSLSFCIFRARTPKQKTCPCFAWLPKVTLSENWGSSRWKLTIFQAESYHRVEMWCRILVLQIGIANQYLLYRPEILIVRIQIASVRQNCTWCWRRWWLLF